MFLLYPFIYVYYFISYVIIVPIYFIKFFFLGIYYSLKNIIHILLESVEYILKIIYLFLKLFFQGIYYIFKNIIHILLKIITYIFKTILIFLKFFSRGMKLVARTLFSVTYKIMHFLFTLIKAFFTGFYVIFRYIFNIVYTAIKLFVMGIYTIFKNIYLVIIFIIRIFISGLKAIYNKVLRPIWNRSKTLFISIANVFKSIWNGIKIVLNSIANVFKKVSSSITYLFTHFKSITKAGSDKVKGYKNDKVKNIKQYFLDKYNNLDVVKYVKNKKDFQRQVLLIDFLDEENVERSEKKQTYKYVARNSDGKIVTGFFDAFSKVDVHSFLLAEGSEVYSIKTSKYIQFLASMKHNKRIVIKYKNLAFLITQLSTYIKAGITLVDALKILSRQETNASRKAVYDSVIYEVVMGASLSEAFEKQGTAFPKLLINMIKTSEMTGKLSEVLDNMAEYYDSAQKTRSQMLSAMLYPSMVFVMATGVIVFVMLAIIPQFVEMFRNMEATLPSITVIVINTSDFLQKNILYVAIGIIALIFIFRFLYSTVKAFRYITQWLMMHLPVMGKIIIYNEVTMFAKTFGSLLTHNVFITDSMEILSKITNNEVYKLLIFDTISNLGRGEDISAAFKNHWAFPRIAYEMLLTGEKTGEVGVMMNKVGDYYQEQHKLSITQIKNFIEPVMIIFLASTVGTILLAIIVPMFSMYQQF